VRDRGRFDFIGRLRFGVSEIRRAEKPCRSARQRFDQALRGGEFKFRHSPWHFAQVRVCERMIADVVSLGDDALDQSRIGLPVLADDEKRRLNVFAFKNVQNLRRPYLIRPVVEGQGNRSRTPADAANDVGRWNLQISLRTYKAVALVQFDLTQAFFRRRFNLQNLAHSLEVHVVSVYDARQSVGAGGIGSTGKGLGKRAGRMIAPLIAPLLTEDRPQRRVFRSQSPQGESRQIVRAGSAHLIERRHSVQEPDRVLEAVVLFVTEKWVARLRIEFDIRFAVSRFKQRLLKRQNSGLAVSPPVIAKSADADYGMGAVQFPHSSGECLFKPRLPGYAARSAFAPMFIVSGQQKIITGRRECAIVPPS